MTIKQTSFESGDLKLFDRVIARACAEIGDCDEATKSIIAARVLSHAADGERDFETLLSHALNRRPAHVL